MTTSYNSTTKKITITLPESAPTWYLNCALTGSPQLNENYSNSTFTNPIDSIEIDYPHDGDSTETININIPQVGAQNGYTFSSTPITWNTGDSTLQNDVLTTLLLNNTELQLSASDVGIASSDNGSFCFNVLDGNGKSVVVDPGFSIIRK